MKKSFLILAAAAGMFAACTNEDAVLDQPVAQQGQTPLAFDAYVNRATTRAGQPGTIEVDQLKTAGFGVFAYYTDNSDYTPYATPNFMYNEQVTYGTSAWEYAPVKYWPNEFGTGAISDDVDKVSFFAYAPYVPVTATTGIPTGNKDKNITQLTKNTASGDPFVKYVVDTDPASSVDLLWGVVNDAADYTAVTGTAAAPTLTAGKPFLDMVKSTVDTKIKFNFKHALAKLNVQIDYDKDIVNAHSGTDDHTGVIDNTQTRIYIRSITISGFAMKGALNLNNSAENTPLWYDYDASKEIVASPVTFYDGRKDGKEATQNGEQKSESPSTLNPVLLQTEACFEDGDFATGATAGVTNTAVNLFNNTKTAGTAEDAIFVIPTNEEMSVTIVYDVETIDPNLPTYLADGVTHGSSVENKIYKEDVFGGNILPGKFYTLKLHLGMTSVKFEAVVTDWVSSTQEIDLPNN